MEIRKIFEYALQREHEGKRFFEQNADRLSHSSATGTFKILADEEQKHIEFIQSLLVSLEKNDTPILDTGIAFNQVGFFSQRADTEMLDQTVSEAMVPDLPILRMAYLIERDFSEFYESASEKTEGQQKEALRMLANWEKGHERLFKYLYDKAFEQYSQMPWGG